MRSGWKTSEFWMMLGAIAAKALVPDMPDEVVYGAMTYVAGRVANKVAETNAISKITSDTK